MREVGPVVLVLGGARSGKSAFAEGRVRSLSPRRTYLAAGRAWDDEMRERIRNHRADRGPDWTTVEEPLDLVGALRAVTDGAVLVDCLTLWVTNLMMEEADLDARFAELIDIVPELSPTVFVSNEVGQGIVPNDAMARAFRDHAGRLHQLLARAADEVWFVTAGLPQRLK